MSVDRRRMSRSRILESAAEILDQGVYGDLTVDALARALHMSKSTLYKYFASKDDVVVSLVEGACDATEASLAALDGASGPPVAALEAIAGVLADHASRLPRAVLLQEARLPSASQDRLAVTRATVGEAFRKRVARGVDAGALNHGDAALAATVFLAGADAAMRASARGEVAGERAAAVRSVLGLLLPGLRNGG